MEIPDGSDVQATGTGHTQSSKVATNRLHRKLGNSLSSLHTSIRMRGNIHKKPKSTHTASAGRLLTWLQGNSNNNKDIGKVHYDTNNAGIQHNTTSSTASCKLPPDHSRHAHKPGSIQACFANAAAKENAAKQQLAPGNAVSTSSLTLLKSHQPRTTLLLTQKCTCNKKS